MTRAHTILEAAHVLGLMPAEARRILEDERLIDGQRILASVEQLEQLALDHYPWMKHADDLDSYWLSTGQAAQVLGLSISRVKQFLDEGRLPYETHRGPRSVRLMRREQIELIANARRARRLRSLDSGSGSR